LILRASEPGLRNEFSYVEVYEEGSFSYSKWPWYQNIDLTITVLKEL